MTSNAVEVDSTEPNFSAADRINAEDLDIFAGEPEIDTAQASALNLVASEDRVSKKDLVQLLEGFVSILKTDGGEVAPLRFDVRGGSARMSEVQVDDRTAEIESLRNLVIEAQDTIIKLLTDRVEDRARIATLEAQVNMLPDLQAQADRAMSVAVRTEEYRSELTRMKFELDRFRLHRVRSEAEKKKGSVFSRVQRWLLSRPLFNRANAADPDAQVLQPSTPLLQMRDDKAASGAENSTVS